MPSDIITQAEYNSVISRYFLDPAFTGLASTLNNSYLWPYCNLPHFGFGRGNAGMGLADYRDAIINTCNNFWDNVNEPMLYWLLYGLEEKKGLLKGHMVPEYRIVPDINIEEYQCNDPNCALIMCEVIDNAGADTLNGHACISPGCGGTFVATGNRDLIVDVKPYCVGWALGCCWLMYGANAAYWAHEVGHNRHLEHCQSQLDSAGNIILDNSGNVSKPFGSKDKQHDAEPNPAFAGQQPSVSAWDRACMMSYNDFDPNYFCGMCILKSRGWAIEHLKNPPGNLS